MFKINDKWKDKIRNKKNLFFDTTILSDTKTALFANPTAADKISVNSSEHSSVFTTQHPSLTEEECKQVKELICQLEL